VKLNGPRLRRELDLRGLTAAAFAVLAGLSAPTMTAALNGRSISPGSAWKIARALAETPAVLDAALLAEDRLQATRTESDAQAA
jgi:transcriptional regulator with XRE-family HTH domain